MTEPTVAPVSAIQAAKASEKAERLWRIAHSIDAQHPYLQAKQLIPYGARQLRQMILLPLRLEQRLVNLQLIDAAGHMRFLTGGQLAGASLILGRIRPQSILLLCQGWANGCTLHRASGRCVIISFSRDNLLALAERLARRLPASTGVIICGDLDPGGAGQRAAALAALSLPRRSRVLFPPFEHHPQQPDPRRHDNPPSDFNDMQQLAGLKAVSAVLQLACAELRDKTNGNSGNNGNSTPEAAPLQGVAREEVFPLALASNGNNGNRPADLSSAETGSDRETDHIAPGFVLQLDGERPGVRWLNLGSDRPPLWICAPLSVSAKTRDDHGGHWGRWLQWQDAEQRPHQWAMPAELTCGDGSELARELARGGLVIDPTRRARELLCAYILHSPNQALARCTERSGWHGDAFVLHDQVIGARAEETLLLQSDCLPNPDTDCSGSLAQWQQQIASAAPGNSRLLFVLSLAFAAPLAELAQQAGGFHLVGGSSIGKSIALDLAASVWGHPREFHLSWRATTNGLEGLCARRNDLLLILDELAQIDPSQAGEAAYLIANGQGKTRASRNGKLQPPHRWRVLLLSAGEIHLGQHLQSIGQRRHAGQELRLLDLDADAGQGLGILDQPPSHGTAAAQMQQLNRACQQYYGLAGRGFLQQLCRQRDAISRQIQAEAVNFIQQNLPADAAGQSHRAAQRFALVASAGELATDWGLTGWPSGSARQALSQLFQQWLHTRGGADDQELRNGLAAVRAFLETHGESRFSPWENNSSRTSQRAGYRREQPDGPYFYVLTQAFRNELCQGFEWQKLARAMAAKGWLKAPSPDRYTSKTRLPGMGDKTCNVYLITPAIWGEDG